MNEIDLSHKNRGPVTKCPKCNGRGSYIDPPLRQQEEEKRAGKRNWIIRTVCVCIRENVDAPAR